MELIKWLQEWYKSNCNGEWEHTHGLQIDTLDNPGWIVKIDLKGTNLDDKLFTPILQEENKSWINCMKKDGMFIGAGSSDKLTEIIQTFRNWVSAI